MPRGPKGVKRIKAKVKADAPRFDSLSSDIDDTIARHCGSNWMETLETVTGNITHIDMDTYKEAISKIGNCEHNIRILLNRIVKQAVGQNLKEFTDIKSAFETECAKYSITTKAVILKGKHQTETVDDKYVPTNIIASDWFKMIKQLENAVYHIIERVFVSPDGDIKLAKVSTERRNLKANCKYADYLEICKKHPNTNDLYTFYGVKITDEHIFDSLLGIQEFANKAINIILTPMYDISKKASSVYDKELASSFKEMIKKGKTTKEVVVTLITNFTIAKYRSTVTGSKKYFTIMLSNELNEGCLAGCDGCDFVDMMDTMKYDSIGSSKTTEFTQKARDLMSRIAKSEGKPMEMMKEVVALINDTPDVKEQVTASPELQTVLAQYDNLLDMESSAPK